MKHNNIAFTLGERKMIQCSDCGIECKSIEMETVSNDDQLIAVRDLMNRVYRSLTRRLAKLFGEQLAAPMLE